MCSVRVHYTFPCAGFWCTRKVVHHIFVAVFSPNPSLPPATTLALELQIECTFHWAIFHQAPVAPSAQRRRVGPWRDLYCIRYTLTCIHNTVRSGRCTVHLTHMHTHNARAHTSADAFIIWCRTNFRVCGFRFHLVSQTRTHIPDTHKQTQFSTVNIGTAENPDAHTLTHKDTEQNTTKPPSHLSCMFTMSQLRRIRATQGVYYTSGFCMYCGRCNI